jgi:hypothetical protein
LVVPHRDRTFDRGRELTTTTELLDRHERDTTADNTEAQHWSVWTHESFLDFCRDLDLDVVDSLEPDDKVGNGFMVVIDAGR